MHKRKVEILQQEQRSTVALSSQGLACAGERRELEIGNRVGWEVMMYPWTRPSPNLWKTLLPTIHNFLEKE